MLLLLSGFDDLGRQFDLNGNLHDWWEPETKLKFLNRTQCIIDQYGNFAESTLQMKVSAKNICDYKQNNGTLNFNDTLHKE